MSIKPISAVCTVLQKWAREAGVEEAPSAPTEGNIAFPFSVAYLRAADIYIDAGPAERDLVDLYLDIHLNRVDLPTDHVKMMTIYEALKPKFKNSPTLEGTVDTLNTSDGAVAHVEYGKMQLGSQETLGLRFLVRVKILEQG
ncbi:MAG: hypothetical protein E6Q97_07975 [Desulfurellales bacterium]|jgi:hypothetical protein|nr:MAG: hypothetical protein E6Q97_07975 [Desulfurellales bacterium]